MNSARVLVLGGFTSYRALFNWISPWILVPTFLIDPIAQIVLFAYLGRSAGIGSDEYFVVGNALQYAAIPCLFAMGNTIGNERRQATLAVIMSTPAPRIPLFLGRALPVILNGFLVALFGLAVGALLFSVSIPLSATAPLLVVSLVTAASCTGLGLVTGALNLRIRETAVLPNIIFGVLLVFSGVNLPIDQLPAWMASVSPWLPMTHGIAAAREVADGTALVDVFGLLGREASVGVGYTVAGMLLLRYLEEESRRKATLETF